MLIAVSLVAIVNFRGSIVTLIWGEPKKPKPIATEADAKEFTGFYWQLIDDYNYSRAYDMLAPEDKKLVSKKEFVRKKAERRFNGPVKVASVVLDRGVASVTLTYKGQGGTKYATDDVIFRRGKWYQKLSVDSLIFDYDADPKDIPGIKRTKVGETFPAGGFDVVVKDVDRNKTIPDGTEPSVPAKGSYVIVAFDVTNVGKRSATWRAGDNVWLFDEHGRVFTAASLPGVNSAVELGPGLSASLRAVFDVPSTDKSFRLLIGRGGSRRLLYFNL